MTPAVRKTHHPSLITGPIWCWSDPDSDLNVLIRLIFHGGLTPGVSALYLYAVGKKVPQAFDGVGQIAFATK